MAAKVQLPVLWVLVISCGLCTQLICWMFSTGNHIVLVGLCSVRASAGRSARRYLQKPSCSAVKHLDRTSELRYAFMGDHLLSGYKTPWYPHAAELLHFPCWDSELGLPTKGSSWRQPWEGSIPYTKSSYLIHSLGFLYLWDCTSFLKFFWNASWNTP